MNSSQRRAHPFFYPIVSGQFEPEALDPDILVRFADRVRRGLFTSRSAYRIVSEERDVLKFESTDWATHSNIGLNRVELRHKHGRVDFEVHFWSWAQLGVGVGLSMFVLLAVIHLWGDRFLPEVWRVPDGDSLRWNWAMMVFWGLVWPWCLIAMHKPHVKRCVTNLLSQSNVRESD